MTGLHVSPSTFALAGRTVGRGCEPVNDMDRNQRRCRRRIALRVSYALLASALVKITFAKAVPGRRVVDRCTRAATGNRGGRTCTRLVALRGTIIRKGRAGSNAFVFVGRIGGRTLGPGSYRLTATPMPSGEPGTPVAVNFRIVR